MNLVFFSADLVTIVAKFKKRNVQILYKCKKQSNDQNSFVILLRYLFTFKSRSDNAKGIKLFVFTANVEKFGYKYCDIFNIV